MEVSGATRSGREPLVLSKPGQQKNLHHGASVSLDHHRLKDARRSSGRQTGSRDRVRICWVLLGSGWYCRVLESYLVAICVPLRAVVPSLLTNSLRWLSEDKQSPELRDNVHLVTMVTVVNTKLYMFINWNKYKQ